MLLRESIELNIREYMGLAETLVSIPQSERGGEIAQRGFDYQTCWALSQMLEYELDEKNYVFIFEYHDDVLILDDEVSPTQLTFAGNDSNLLIVFYVQIMPDDFVMQLHRF